MSLILDENESFFFTNNPHLSYPLIASKWSCSTPNQFTPNFWNPTPLGSPGKKKKHPWLQPNSRKPSDVCEVRNLGVIRCFIISNGMTSATFHLKRHVERNVCFCKNKCPPCMASAYSFELLATLAVACCQRELDGTSYTLLRCRILKNTKKTMCQTFWAWTRSSEVVDKEFF